MGGYGSGRTGARGKKGTVEAHCSVDVRQWHRQGLLWDGRQFSVHWSFGQSISLELAVRVEVGCVVIKSCFDTGKSEPHEGSQTVFLDWTPCHFGGERPWLLCPIASCSRRVAILYWGGGFACRRCMNLCYQSQLDATDTRASKRVDRTRTKLGWPPGFLNGVGWKPKHMHWKTFGTLLRRYEQEVGDVKLKLMARFKLVDDNLVDILRGGDAE